MILIARFILFTFAYIIFRVVWIELDTCIDFYCSNKDFEIVVVGIVLVYVGYALLRLAFMRIG